MSTESFVKDIINEAQHFRSEAKKALKKSEIEIARIAFEEAHSQLNRAEIELNMKAAPDSADPMDGDFELALQFADLWGIRGGTYRDMAAINATMLETAIQSYDQGAEYEHDFKLKSTYNIVNQLVVRIISDPELLNDAERQITLKNKENEVTATTREWLSRAEKHVMWSLPRRQDKVWAHADLVMLSALRSSLEIEVHWKKFVSQVKHDGDDYPFESLLAVLRNLVKLPLKDKTTLLKVGEDLRGKLPTTKQGDALVG